MSVELIIGRCYGLNGFVYKVKDIKGEFTTGTKSGLLDSSDRQPFRIKYNMLLAKGQELTSNYDI